LSNGLLGKRQLLPGDFLSSELIDPDVTQYLQEPRLAVRAGLKRLETLKGPQERLLHQIVGFLTPAAEGNSRPVYSVEMGKSNLFECFSTVQNLLLDYVLNVSNGQIVPNKTEKTVSDISKGTPKRQMPVTCGRSSSDCKATNLLDWCEAPTKVKQAKGSLLVRPKALTF
jgi:hypothetical protein